MPAETFWYHEKRIIYHRYSGNILVTDVDEASLQSLNFTLEGAPPVHVLVDLSGVSNFPKSVNVFRAALKPAQDPGRIGWVIIFGSHNMLLRFTASTLAHIAGARSNVRVMDTLDQAIAFLEERDSSLINLESYAGYHE